MKIGKFKNRIIPFLLCLYPSGCAPIPHEEGTLHEIGLKIRRNSGYPVTASITNIYTDSMCSNPIRKLTVTSEETNIVKGNVEKRLWLLLLPNDPLSGFRICLETSGKRYYGIQYFHFGFSSKHVDVECEISSTMVPTEDWSISRVNNDPRDICSIKMNRFGKRF